MRPLGDNLGVRYCMVTVDVSLDRKLFQLVELYFGDDPEEEAT